MDQPRRNYGIKDEIRTYWDERSATFDQSWGHGIKHPDERAAWNALLRGALTGHCTSLSIVELGSGTGVITELLCDLGHQVTAVDLSHGMQAKAREKLAPCGDRAVLIIGDAENTMLPDRSFDVAICRHLVWTLPEPARALTDWHRILRPGGRLILLEGEWSRSGWHVKLLQALAKRLETTEDVQGRMAAYDAIRPQLPFVGGTPARDLARLVEAAGFREARVRPLSAIRRAENRHAPLSFRLRRSTNRRYLLTAVRPAEA